MSRHEATKPQAKRREGPSQPQELIRNRPQPPVDMYNAETRKQKIQIAEQWLQREIATLDKKSQDYDSVASRSASFAASKVHSLISHLRDVNLLSASFMSLMESWHELDACHAAACKLKPKQIDAYADTQVVL